MKPVAVILLVLRASWGLSGAHVDWGEDLIANVNEEGLLIGEGTEMVWEDEFHIYSQEVDLISGVVTTYEIWNSLYHNRSRIDKDGGVSKKYYITRETDDDDITEIYTFSPTVDDDENPTQSCVLEESTSTEHSDYMPDFMIGTYYEFQGHEWWGGLLVLKYENITEDVATKKKITFYVTQEVPDSLDEIISQPVQLISEEWDVPSGKLTEYKIHTFMSYQNFTLLEDLQPDKTRCKEEYSFADSLASLDPSVPGDEQTAFELYKKYHRKSYDHDDEHSMRAKIFHKNWKLVQEHNKENHRYKLHLNQFADRLPSELPLQVPHEISGPIVGTHPFPLSENEARDFASSLPQEYDLRAEGYVTPVVNQAGCGSCWAFAIAAAMEGTLARANDGEFVDLSEQSLVDCAWNFGAYGCQGAIVEEVFKYIIKYGLPTEMQYGPYLEIDGVCAIHNMTTLHSIRGYTAVTPKSPNALKTALFKSGPVVVAILANDKFLFYKHGIFYDTECDGDSSLNIINHAVTVVGYGHEDGDLYWIVKNSYGGDWGEDGYIRMSARNNNCNLMNQPLYPLM